MAPSSSLRCKAVLRLSCLVPLALAGWGCAGASPHTLDRHGVPLADTPPAPYRVAIAPLVLGEEFSRAQAGPEGRVQPRVVFSAQDFRTRLIDGLARHRTLSEAFPVGALDLLEAQDGRADLLLRLQWADSRITSEGPAGGAAWMSALLWATTWAGSLWIRDSEYATGCTLRGSLVNPYLGRTVQRFTITTGPVRLSFWERNPFLSLGLLQSLVLPPFWTSDDRTRTDQRLSEEIVAQLAAELARFFKDDLAAVEDPAAGASARIRIEQPDSAGAASSYTHVAATVSSPHPIQEALLFLNGRPVAAIPAPTQPGADGHYRLDIARPVALLPGRNDLQLRVLAEGEITSRTVVVHNPETATFEMLEVGPGITPAQEDR